MRTEKIIFFLLILFLTPSISNAQNPNISIDYSSSTKLLSITITNNSKNEMIIFNSSGTLSNNRSSIFFNIKDITGKSLYSATNIMKLKNEQDIKYIYKIAPESKSYFYLPINEPKFKTGTAKSIQFIIQIGYYLPEKKDYDPIRIKKDYIY